MFQRQGRRRRRGLTQGRSQTWQLLNERYRREFDRAEQLAAELRDIHSSRLWPWFRWLRQTSRSLRGWFGAVRGGEVGVHDAFTPFVPQPGVLPATFSIIIPFKDHLDLLQGCLQAVRRTTLAEQPEIILVDNGSREPRLVRALRRWRERGRGLLLSRPGPFNFAALCNDGARVASGDLLVFLNNDVQPLHDRWLVELAQLTADARVGAAGATLLYPDGTLQHVGMKRDAAGRWHHPYRHEPGDAAGWEGELHRPRVVPAATAACLAISRERFHAVGGFDERFPVTGNDVDLCLRLRERGWVTVVSPFARLLHFESLSRGYTREAVA
jgi:GT2 family glycosyltransferase